MNIEQAERDKDNPAGVCRADHSGCPRFDVYGLGDGFREHAPRGLLVWSSSGGGSWLPAHADGLVLGTGACLRWLLDAAGEWPMPVCNGLAHYGVITRRHFYRVGNGLNASYRRRAEVLVLACEDIPGVLRRMAVDMAVGG